MGPKTATKRKSSPKSRKQDAGRQEATVHGDTDGIVDNYRSILSELSLLATVSVLLFGFLLSVGTRDSTTTTEQWLLFSALISVSSATLVFILPVAYHRMEFPYQN